jgi:hypothetical protein
VAADDVIRVDPKKPFEWGEPLGYLTDDRDVAIEKQRVLWIAQGPNGDWYVTTTERWNRPSYAARICTSGGAAARVPPLVRGIADAYRAMADFVRGRAFSTSYLGEGDLDVSLRMDANARSHDDGPPPDHLTCPGCGTTHGGGPCPEPTVDSLLDSVRDELRANGHSGDIAIDSPDR